MASYALRNLKAAQLSELCEIDDRGILPELWARRPTGELSERERARLEDLSGQLVSFKVQLVKEATVWSRAIYPLLAMAERDKIWAFSEVSMAGTFGRGELRGEVDGALAHMGLDGDAVAPFFVVVEAKRGVEGTDPVAQLLGALLCAAAGNHARSPRAEHVLYGAFTIADTWTFCQARISRLDGERPLLVVTWSREFRDPVHVRQLLAALAVGLDADAPGGAQLAAVEAVGASALTRASAWPKLGPERSAKPASEEDTVEIRLSELSKLPEEERARALSAFVDQARGKPNGQIKALDAEIAEFEIRYEMSSEDMRAGFRAGTVRDTADIAKWLILLGVRDRARR